MMPVLILTRPRDAALRLLRAVERALGRDVAAVIAPVLRIDDLDPGPVPIDAEPVLTSEHGARAAARLGYRGRVWCVGARTAKVAQHLGLDPISANADGQALIRLIETMRPAHPLIHVRGEDMAVDMARALRKAGFEASDCVAYRACAQPLSTAAREVLDRGDPVVIPVFSPRSARVLRDQITPDRPATRWVAISANAADPLPPPVRIAAHPDMEAMVAAICAEISPDNAR